MKILYATLIAAFAAFFTPAAFAADVLTFRYNDDVVIKIANVACPLKVYKEKYPWGAIAARSDGQFLFGCYRKLNENDIEIQWAGGDTSTFPANVFLFKPEAQQEQKPEKPAWTPPQYTEPTL